MAKNRWDMKKNGGEVPHHTFKIMVPVTQLSLTGPHILMAPPSFSTTLGNWQPSLWFMKFLEYNNIPTTIHS